MSNRINILNASAEDFAIEVLASTPSGSQGDHEDGRIVKYLTHFYVWHDASGAWKKFGNSTDIASLETRLSAQESECVADEGSLQAIDASLETRISVEESARIVAVDSAEVRAQGVESSLETRLSSEEVARAADVSSEASRAAAAEGSVELRLSQEEVAAVSAVDSAEARAIAAETSLQTRLSSEESAELAAEGSLDSRASSEESARLAADTSIASDIATAASDRATADTSIQTRLGTEEGRVDAILLASTADKNTFVETVSYINAVDVLHDAQTSTEISSIDSAIASAESARISDDSSLETRLSNEESAELSAEGSLDLRMSAEESAELAAEGSLNTRLSAEESARLAADNSLSSRSGTEEAAMAAADSSLETRLSTEESVMAAEDNSLETVLSGHANDRGAADVSLTTRLSIEESAMLSAVASAAALRASEDVSLQTRISSEEVARAAADTSIQLRLSQEEDAMAVADSSLELRLSQEESAELSAEGSLDSRVSSEASAQVLADASLQTRFSGEVSVEQSRIDAILDSASADKDTFVEIVSFITAVDTESDDALASYVVAVDADISAEESSRLAADGSLQTVISDASTARASAVTSLEANHSAQISTQAANIDAMELNEDSRHMRIDFTSKTAFTVAKGDFPSGFSPDEHGLVQVFQEVSSGVYRHLIAPVSIDASGDLSVDLGSTAKTGFAVFYSFADDETTVSEVSSALQWGLGSYSVEGATSSGAAGAMGYSIQIRDYVGNQGIWDGAVDSNGSAKWYVATGGGSFSLLSATGSSLSASDLPSAVGEGDTFSVYMEWYDSSSNLEMVAGSSSAPYYFTAAPSMTIDGTYNNYHTDASAVWGDVVDVTVNISGAGGSTFNAFTDIQGNSSAVGYNSYSTTWAISGTDASIVKPLDSWQSPNGSNSFYFAADTIPAVGTYYATITIENNTFTSGSNPRTITVNYTFNVTA